MHALFYYILCFAGFFFLFGVVFPVILIIFRYTILKKLFSKRKLLRTAGEWAIVTGASDGIGLAFAHQLASDGLNIMLISRTKSKLECAAAVLQATHGVSTKCVAVDFTKTDVYEDIKREIDLLPSIACLVNNVGMVNLNPQLFASGEDMCLAKLNDFIACNDVSMAMMTYIVLPRLVRQNSNAALINVASFSSIQPLPLISLYGATKNFVKYLSDCLALELHRKNVLIQTLCPMYVATSMVSGHRSFFVVSPEECAKGSLDMLGVEQCTMGTLLHALQIFYFSFIPDCFFRVSMWQKMERAERRKRRSKQ